MIFKTLCVAYRQTSPDVGEPLEAFASPPEKTVSARPRVMETVGLSQRFIKRYPTNFRVNVRHRIARGCRDPDVTCRRTISALDVSIQAQV